LKRITALLVETPPSLEPREFGAGTRENGGAGWFVARGSNE